LKAKWKTKYSGPNGSRHSDSSACTARWVSNYES